MPDHGEHSLDSVLRAQQRAAELRAQRTGHIDPLVAESGLSVSLYQSGLVTGTYRSTDLATKRAKFAALPAIHFGSVRAGMSDHLVRAILITMAVAAYEQAMLDQYAPE